jgi:hypothetical protein
VVKRILFLSLLSCSDVEKKVRGTYTVVPLSSFLKSNWKSLKKKSTKRFGTFT